MISVGQFQVSIPISCHSIRQVDHFAVFHDFCCRSFPDFMIFAVSVHDSGFHDLWFVVTVFEGFWFKSLTLIGFHSSCICTKSYKIRFATDIDIISVRKVPKSYFLLQILTFSMYETLKKFMLCFWCWQFQCFIQFQRFMRGCRCWDSTATAVLIENLFEELLIVSSKICKNVPHQKVCLSLVARGQGWIFEWLVSWWYWYTCYQSG